MALFRMGQSDTGGIHAVGCYGLPRHFEETLLDNVGVCVVYDKRMLYIYLYRSRRTGTVACGFLLFRGRMYIGCRCLVCRLARSARSEEHTSELQSRQYLVCRLLLEKKKK